MGTEAERAEPVTIYDGLANATRKVLALYMDVQSAMRGYARARREEQFIPDNGDTGKCGGVRHVEPCRRCPSGQVQAITSYPFEV